MRPTHTFALVAAAPLTALALLLAGCGTGPSLENQGTVTAPPGDSTHLTIGSAGFTESDLLAQMYALLLDHAGYRTRVLSVTNREIYEPALESGQIDVVPEYAATFADWLNAKVHGSGAAPVGSPDLATTMKALRRLAAGRGLAVLTPGRAVDQNAYAVTRAYARKHGLKNLSDVGRAGLRVRLAAGDECVSRPYCAPGLRGTYGISVTGIDPKGIGTTPSKRAVQRGKDQMLVTTTTDATLDDFGLVLLDDDKHLQNADHVVPVVGRARAGSHRIAAALDPLGRVLTTRDLASMNEQVDSWRRLPEDVARAYLRAKGLLPAG
ncbi:ABC transporter substrate-binding protein [Streptomyces montanisoli]|uniref:ABC transporter substrate-binding protein n=1 Tax=Streptomyces montanisoli TaxID=2798581 RepID=A0A940ME10_9ACTN|nr:ABC transporter substrate-binding protein [Streptomyces montanisoli]MBP0458270.1 ABC transporter substrate-binding protein [Streptomyces montanisoli]